MKVILLIFFVGGTLFLGGCTKHKHSDSNPAPKASTLEKYQCPMHPQIIKDRQEGCPICGMDLVKVNNEVGSSEPSHSKHPHGHSAIDLSIEKQQLIGVKLTKVVRKKLFRQVKAPGRVAFDPELYTAQSEYVEAVRQLRRVKQSPLPSVKKNVRRMVESAKIRLRVLGLSEDQIKLLGKGGFRSESLLVSQKKGKVWIYAEVFEMDLRNIEKGQSVKMSSSFLEGERIVGTVISTDDVINPKTRTAKVRIQVQDPQVRLRPESYVDVNILVPQGEHVALPEDAIVDTGEESFVFVRVGEGKFEPRKVGILFRAGDEVAISGGVEENEQIVTGANFLIDSESRLKSVLSQMGS